MKIEEPKDDVIQNMARESFTRTPGILDTAVLRTSETSAVNIYNRGFREGISYANGKLDKAEPVEAWKPIETAPKDGTEIIVCRAINADKNPIPQESFGLFVQRVSWWGEDSEWVVYCSMVKDPGLFFEPTHWMPIPKAPSAKAAEPWKPVEGKLYRSWSRTQNMPVRTGWFCRERDMGSYEFEFEGSSWEYSHCAIIDSIDEIGKPPSYFIERDERHI